MSFAKTSKINIFPLSKSRPADTTVYDSRRIYEYSIANIIRQMTDNPGFVISSSKDDDPFKFNLHGYYVELSDSDILSTTPLYAVMKFTDQGWTAQIDGQDTGEGDNKKYEGIDFVNTKPSSDSVYIQLLDVDGAVPEASRYRLTSDVVKIDGLRPLGGTSS